MIGLVLASFLIICFQSAVNIAILVLSTVFGRLLAKYNLCIYYRMHKSTESSQQELQYSKCSHQANDKCSSYSLDLASQNEEDDYSMNIKFFVLYHF